ncbi:hypothetical protein [Paludisphaera mucosa]|uniref:ABC-2 family transporter protein n=1 Tax=Paludisphaera mucosa TaxID=3030827 RepID=A0ABT6FG16_9BACT|nr:hypothetical protein [Paludisphaera mucosa]MDG3006504.1 hypothetical protein [Paludisphaera mucosa]
MFREWLDNPIFVKHVRSRLRSQALASSIAVTVLICLCIMYGTYLSGVFGSGDGFTALLVLQFILLGVMGSTQVGASVGNARASGILDFHRVSPQSPLELACGFLFGAPVREYLLAALTIPFMIFCIWMGTLDFRALLQAEILMLFTAWTLHAISLLGGLAMKGAVTGQNALGFTVVIGVFVVGPLFGSFRYLNGLLNGEVHMDFFRLSLPWLAFVLLHLIAVLFFFMLAATRKMGSERLHGLTKPQAMAAMATIGLLAVGGMTNWSGDGTIHLIGLYILTVAGLLLVGLTTPTLAEYDKGLRRTRKLGIPRLSAWSDAAPNRPTVAAICGILLVAGTLLGFGVVDGSMRSGVPTAAGFPMAVADGVLIVAYFGLSYQYFLLRFGRRSSNFFGLFLFVAWALPLVLGVITIVSIGPRMGDSRPAMIFSATPIVGIAAATGVFQNEAGSGPVMVTITLALLFTFVFARLYGTAVRRARLAVEHSDVAPTKLEPEAIDVEVEPAASPG